MSEGLRKAAICYGNPGTWIYSDCGPEQTDTNPEEYERMDHIAADGTKLSYAVGPRRFIERTVRWQSDTLLAQWVTFMTTHALKGKEFWYYDNTPTLYGASGVKFGDAGLKYGGDSTGVLVTLEGTEFRPVREDAYGYWQFGLRMRRYV